MVFQLIKLNIDVSDDDFNLIYPESIRKLSRRHWTPVAVAKLAADFLAGNQRTRILDIGSGVGKFCMVGSVSSKGIFTGIEQRENLYKFCVKAAQKHHLSNVNYILGNVTTIDFGDYDGFYFYNSFRENIDQTAVIDQSVETGLHLSEVYPRCVHDKLAACKVGTRLATYCTSMEMIPANYSLVSNSFEGRLKMFEKIN